jgi:hypothetical protein
MEPHEVHAIGVDGGASGVRALAVRRRSDGALEAAGPRAVQRHAPFDPPPLALQRDEAPAPRVPADERAAASARVHAAADAVAEAAVGARRVAVGVCWPGLKSAGGRGVVVLRNGPRDPDLATALERALAARGLELARPLPPIASDGVAGALGELYAANGALRGVRCALYLAGGTGLAEALLVGGRVVALDDPGVSMPKAWQMEHEGATFEDHASPGGWSRALSTGERDDAPVDWGQRVARDPAARAVVERAARVLAAGLVDRAERLRAATGTAPEIAVVGARLGEQLARADLAAVLRVPLEQALERAGLPAGFLRPSTFLDAPCFGAAALALDQEVRA